MLESCTVAIECSIVLHRHRTLDLTSDHTTLGQKDLEPERVFGCFWSRNAHVETRAGHAPRLRIAAVVQLDR